MLAFEGGRFIWYVWAVIAATHKDYHHDPCHVFLGVHVFKRKAEKWKRFHAANHPEWYISVEAYDLEI